MAVVLTVLSLTVSVASGVTPERERKADYYFMEALSREAAGESDAAFLLLRRAVELDSVSSSVPGGMLGGRMMGLSRGDSTLFMAGLHLLERHFEASPADLYSGYNLALNYERIGRTDKALGVWQVLDSLNSDNVSVLWHRAAVESRYGSAFEALRLMDRIETLEGLSPQTVMQQTRLLLETGDTAAATARVDTMLAAMPADADARVFAAAYFDNIGLPDSADVYIDRALALDPANGAAYYQRAQRYKSRGLAAEYYSEIAAALRLDDLDRESKIGLMSDYLSEYADSVDRRHDIDTLLNQLLGQYPHDEELRRYVSGYYVGIGDYGRAAEQLAYVADMNHDDSQVWSTLIRLYATVDSLDQSVAAAREAVEYQPADPSLRQLLGMVLSRIGDYDGAIGTFRGALALIPADDNGARSEILTSMGDVWQQAGRTDSVVTCYEQAIAMDPDNDLALNNYAYYLAETGRELARAEQMSSRSMMLRPGQSTYLDTYAWILYHLGDYQKAKEYIDTAIMRSGDDRSAELMEHAGDIAYKLGREELALEYWKEGLELDPSSESLRQRVTVGKPE